MAIVIGAFGGSTTIGKVGSKVFQRGPFGNVLRNLTLPVNPKTQRQQAVRLTFDSLAQSWKTLPVTLLEAWRQFASVTPVMGPKGTTQELTGRMWYFKSNFLIVFNSGVAKPDPPPVPGITNPPSVLVGGNAGSALQITSIGSTLVADDLVLLQVSPPLANTNFFFKGSYAFTDFLNASSVFPFILQPTVLIAGQRFFIQYRLRLSDGRVSNNFDEVYDVP